MIFSSIKIKLGHMDFLDFILMSLLCVTIDDEKSIFWLLEKKLNKQN